MLLLLWNWIQHAIVTKEFYVHRSFWQHNQHVCSNATQYTELSYYRCQIGTSGHKNTKSHAIDISMTFFVNSNFIFINTVANNALFISFQNMRIQSQRHNNNFASLEITTISHYQSLDKNSKPDSDYLKYPLILKHETISVNRITALTRECFPSPTSIYNNCELIDLPAPL